MQTDLSNRQSDINWPDEFSPETAELFSHNQLIIHASAEKIWRCIIDVKKWPQWYPNARNITLIGNEQELSADSIFRWNTFGIDLESKVNEYDVHRRLGWFGYTPGEQPNFYHTWHIQSLNNYSCLVTTEEAGIGYEALAFRENNQGLLHRGHDLWLATLKWVAEDC